jgi:hypothetical protein
MPGGAVEKLLLTNILEEANGLHSAGTLSPKVLAALARHLNGRGIRRSIETGSGASTLLFSHASEDHTVFALDDGSGSVENVRSSALFNRESTTFVLGPTQKTLPAYQFHDKIQAALLDGPHGFPFPQLEYFHIYPFVEPRGLLIVDDIHIPSVHDLFCFLKADEMFVLVDIVQKTAFFERTTAAQFDPLGDGWWLQGYNRRLLLRFTWLDKLKALVPASARSRGKAAATRARDVAEHLLDGRRWFVTVSAPRHGEAVGRRAMVRGRAAVPPGGRLWLFARRIDQPGWWPQGEGCIDVRDEEWSQVCKYGEISDVGSKFQMTVLVLDERASARVERWVLRAKETGVAPPIPLPAHVAGCPAVQVTVIKTSHADFS